MPEKHSNIRIFYETDSYLIAEKPPGIPVHATKDSKRENFTDRLQAQLSLEYLRTVNRLDLDTSGLVFFCKDPDKNKEADAIIKASEKIYLCVCSGIVEEKHFTETCYIKDGNKKVRKVFSGGDKAITEFITLKNEKRDGYSVLLAKLHTGRRHQIRFHLSEKGHPILGDLVYGASIENKRTPHAKRSLLHALEISFRTQDEKEERIFCPPPSDFQKFLDGIVLDSSVFSKFSVK
ncbi:RNA pseudouridine synthase [Leptospira kmetyi]|uniref:RluA family pseudouridine synthase n=1 Tax=Leptospira kmetyi TaxID=408139 RepID=UPI0003905EDB|nr:pseudouridine synthase [Leptospira kmetyi]EQA52062.1 RNA pseudouridine synthase [Leptospira kmetyi serovar Malaysia str. Bejo-Iso9]PJZ42702.1 RNA pseudouridine synthase [Leptospira kmetyi]